MRLGVLREPEGEMRVALVPNSIPNYLSLDLKYS